MQKLDAQGRAYATGKRKNAIARVWIKPGTGKITVNGKEFNAFFARPVLQMILQQPIVAAARKDQYDVVATVTGGGLSGQAGARPSRHLAGADPLRARASRRAQEGRLPDPRQPRASSARSTASAKARRTFQFSKR